MTRLVPEDIVWTIGNRHGAHSCRDVMRRVHSAPVVGSWHRQGDALGWARLCTTAAARAAR